ncbi:hypothetical protein MNAN1_001666 [Malassezia nana]|uniref:BTB domain-containing protein n=1 Tax=Malassezia nana TaxID=180528 RepID=A0AAF0EKW4_9BASI|nr:hypothetical protein MNAN1_001666 [Malassezia nana]
MMPPLPLAESPVMELHHERSHAFRMDWVSDLKTLYRLRPKSDAVWRPIGPGSFSAHRDLVAFRARRPIREALLGHKRLFRREYRVPWPASLLESVLAWAYTGAEPEIPALARALRCSEAEAQAHVAHDLAQDWRAWAEAHPAGSGGALHQAVVSLRCPALCELPWITLPIATQHQVASLLHTGGLASTNCTIPELLACADLLYAFGWSQAAQLVDTAACAQAAWPQARGYMSRAVAFDDKPLQASLLAWMSTSPQGTAVLPVVPRALYVPLCAQLEAHASASTLLAFVKAMHEAQALPPAMHPLIRSRFLAMLETPQGQALVVASDPLLQELVSILLTTLRAESAPGLYAMLVGNVMLADDRPLPTGPAWDVLEHARRTLVEFLQHHWMEARAAHAFDPLARWCIKELADELDVDAAALPLSQTKRAFAA